MAPSINSNQKKFNTEQRLNADLTLDNLPNDVLQIISSHLDTESLVSLSKTSNSFKAATLNEVNKRLAENIKNNLTCYSKIQDLLNRTDRLETESYKNLYQGIIQTMGLYDHLMTTDTESLKQLQQTLKSQIQDPKIQELSSKKTRIFERIQDDTITLEEIYKEYQQFEFNAVIRALEHVIESAPSPKSARGWSVVTAAVFGQADVIQSLLSKKPIELKHKISATCAAIFTAVVKLEIKPLKVLPKLFS